MKPVAAGDPDQLERGSEESRLLSLCPLQAVRAGDADPQAVSPGLSVQVPPAQGQKARLPFPLGVCQFGESRHLTRHALELFSCRVSMLSGLCHHPCSGCGQMLFFPVLFSQTLPVWDSSAFPEGGMDGVMSCLRTPCLHILPCPDLCSVGRWSTGWWVQE